jgi:Flp pilus assembly protein TadG
MMSSGRSNTLLGRFLRNKSGNFAIAFAFTSVAIFLSVGLAVDYSRSVGQRTRVNNALDAASLATARALSIGEISDTGSAAEDYFKAVFAANLGIDDLGASDYSVDNFTIDTASQTISATAEYDQPLTFISVGSSQTSQAVGTKSAASYGIGDIEVAMVLDVTGSMSGYNITSLKSAATLGIEELLTANTGTDEHVRISLVPYSDSVNAGVLAPYVYPDYNEAESDAPVYDSSYTAGYDVDTFQADYKTNCYYVGYDDGLGITDYADLGDDGYEAFVINAAFPGGYSGRGGDGYVQYASHRGRSRTYTCFLEDDFIVEDDGTSVDNCATDRKAPTSGTSYQYTDANPSYGMISRDSRLDEDGCTSSALVALTSNETTLKNSINGLSTGGCTAGHIGLQWAWYTISKNWADYLPAGSKPGDMSTDDDLAKYIILMTDGAFNTAYAGTSSNSVGCSKSTLSTGHTSSLCTAIKSAGIKIFTIGFGTSNSADTMLEACASPDEGTLTYSYEPNTADELKDTYEHIASLIQSLRLTQ